MNFNDILTSGRIIQDQQPHLQIVIDGSEGVIVTTDLNSPFLKLQGGMQNDIQ